MNTNIIRNTVIGSFLAVTTLAAPASAFAASAQSSSHATTNTVAAKVTKQVVANAAVHLLSLINADRAAHNRKPLVLDTKQSACSRKHSVHMQQLNVLSHDQFPADVCVSYRWVAENVGYSDGDPMAAVGTIHNLMLKEGPCSTNPCSNADFEVHGHYVNLMDTHFKKIGIGIVIKDGTTWVTENFTG